MSLEEFFFLKKMDVIMAKIEEKKFYIEYIYFTQDCLVIDMVNGVSISFPILFFPKLWHANEIQRQDYKFSVENDAIYWPNLNEYLCIEEIIAMIYHIRGNPEKKEEVKESSQKDKKKTRTFFAKGGEPMGFIWNG